MSLLRVFISHATKKRNMQCQSGKKAKDTKL